MKHRLCLLFFLTFIGILAAGCPAKNNPSNPNPPTPTFTPNPTSTPVIQAGFSASVTGAAGGEEMIYSFVNFSACTPCTVSSFLLVAPVTFQISGPTAPFSNIQTLNGYNAVNSVGTQIPGTTVALGQSVTWVLTWEIPQADINQSWINGLDDAEGAVPADPMNYNFSGEFSQQMQWVLTAYATYSFGSGGPGGILAQAGATGPYMETYNQLEALVTLVLNIPAAIP